MGYLDLALSLPETGPGYDGNDRNDKTPSAWDHAEAERLLAELCAEVKRLTREQFGGDRPTLFRTLADDLVAIGEGYIRNYDAEAIRGWDALDLLRGLKPILLRMTTNMNCLKGSGR